MQALSRVEEQAVITAARKEATAACDDKVRAFAECSRDRTFSMAWACKTQLNDWTECMRAIMTEEKLDSMKLDYLQNRQERKRADVELAKKEMVDGFRRHAGIKEEPKV